MICSLQDYESLFGCDSRVGFLVPIHHLVDILVVLFETSKLFLHKDTSAVVEMVSRCIFQILHALPTGPSRYFTLVLVSEVDSAENTKAE